MTGFRVGYKGQRYEVSYENKDGKRLVVGWTDEKDGGVLVKCVQKHPSFKNAQVKDLKGSEKWEKWQKG